MLFITLLIDGIILNIAKKYKPIIGIYQLFQRYKKSLIVEWMI